MPGLRGDRLGDGKAGEGVPNLPDDAGGGLSGIGPPNRAGLLLQGRSRGRSQGVRRDLVQDQRQQVNKKMIFNFNI